MKKIVAFFKPGRLEAIKESMLGFGYKDVRWSYIKSHTLDREIVWKGKTYVVEILPKAKMEAIVADADTEKIVNRVTELVRSRPAGPGLNSDIEYALKVKGEARSKGRWVRLTPAGEAPASHEPLEVVEIRA